jgi:diguanylate cyclase
VSAELSGEKGLEAARKALASLEEHGATPLPKHYEVWLHYHAGTRPELRAEIDKALALGRPVDDFICAKLHARFLDDASYDEKVRRAGDTMASEMAGMVQGLSAVRRQTSAFNTKLVSASAELAGTSDPHAVRQLLSGLSQATASMNRETTQLEQKLDATTREMTALRAELEAARAEAATDALTGVANRKVFEEQLADALSRDPGRGNACVLLIGDIDHFKQVNDTWGHQTGDQVIRFVASVMSRFAPENSTVARIGGEEFALLMPSVPLERARSVAQHIRATVEGKRLVRRSSNEDLGRITISLGVAAAVRGESGESLVGRADQALYASKRGGRNQVTVADAADARAA